MTIALAATWHPRGELPRLVRLLPRLGEVYQSITISLPPFAEAEVVKDLQAISQSQGAILQAPVVTSDWRAGRFQALVAAMEHSASHVQYADLDRLLRWVETRPLEWRQIAEMIEACECLVIGRTDQAYATHPRALVETEAISNMVASHFMGRKMDFSAGSKGFNREAARYLAEHGQSLRAMGTDAEWPILLQRAGFVVDYVEVDGLDWEIADHEQASPAGPERQRQLAAEYDADPAHWYRRAAVSHEIVQSALEASARERDTDGTDRVDKCGIRDGPDV